MPKGYTKLAPPKKEEKQTNKTNTPSAMASGGLLGKFKENFINRHMILSDPSNEKKNNPNRKKNDK